MKKNIKNPIFNMNKLSWEEKNGLRWKWNEDFCIESENKNDE